MNEDRERLDFLERLGSMSKFELWVLLAVINCMIFRNRMRAIFPTTAARMLALALLGVLAWLVWLAL